MQINMTNIERVDLLSLMPYVPKCDLNFFLSERGEHYRFLAYMSSIVNNATIYDIGTLHGSSALALSYNRTNKVISFDITNNRVTDLNPSTIEFRLQNILENTDEFLRSAPIILLDTAHEGPFEHEFYKRMKDINYKGFLILDDIWLNEPMAEFWKSIEEPKYDLTGFAHYSGTGLVDFSGQLEVLFSGSYYVKQQFGQVPTAKLKKVEK